MTDRPLSELFFAIVTWAESLGAKAVNQLPDCWEHDFDFEGTPAHVTINGHKEDRNSSDGFTVGGFHALVMINGWPAVLCNPVEGMIMNGEPDAEDRLIAAFQKAADERPGATP